MKGSKKPLLLPGPLARDSNALYLALLMHKELSSFKWEVWEKTELWTCVCRLCPVCKLQGVAPLCTWCLLYFWSVKTWFDDKLCSFLTRKYCLSYQRATGTLFANVFSLFCVFKISTQRNEFPYNIFPNLLCFCPSPFSCPSSANPLLPPGFQPFLKPWFGDSCVCLTVLWLT